MSAEHHFHPNPDVDDMLRAANARAEAAEAERDRLAEKAEWWERTCVYWNGQAQDALRFRDAAAATAEAAERRLAEQQAAVLALADEADTEWHVPISGPNIRESDFRQWRCLPADDLRAALSDPTALDALIARERAAALAPLKALADAWEREAEPYLPGGKRYAKASDSLVMRADCRDLDAARLRYAIRDIERKAEQ